MSSPDERAEPTSADGTPDEIIVRLTDDRAISFSAPSETKPSRWVGDLTTSELRILLQTLDPVTRSVIEVQRLTAHLVELDPISHTMWKSGFETVTEAGGWMQANLRDNGKFARLMRVRPATGLAVMAGGAAILGAIATQAQAAEMARDVKAIRLGVLDIKKHLQSDQIGAVENAVEQVEKLVELLREHGADGVSDGDLQTVRVYLGDQKRKCIRHLTDAAAKLNNVDQGSPRRAEKGISQDAVEEVMRYLHLLGKLHAAEVQLEHAQIAVDYHRGRLDVVRTRTAQLTNSAGQFRTEIEDVLDRLTRLDESIRARFRPAGGEKSGLLSAASAGASVVAREVVGPKSVPVRVGRASIQLPLGEVAAVAGAVLPHVAVEVNAAIQSRAEKKVNERLMLLTGASRGIAEVLNHTAQRLELLRTFTEELAGLGETVADGRPETRTAVPTRTAADVPHEDAVGAVLVG